MLKIEIKSTALTQKSGTGKKSGKAYSFREQHAYAHLPGKPYPVEIKLTRNDDQPAYEPGMYQLSADSFFVDGFQSLAVSPRLTPVPAGK